MISFDLPWAFILIPLPLLCYWLLPSLASGSAALRVPLLEQWRQASSDSTVSNSIASIIKLLLLIVVWLLLVTSAAQPMWRGEPVPQPASGRDLMLAVDISG